MRGLTSLQSAVTICVFFLLSGCFGGASSSKSLLSSVHATDSQGESVYIPDTSDPCKMPIVPALSAQYTVSCAICHGPQGQGIAPFPALTGNLDLVSYISVARAGRGAMPPFAAATISDSDLQSDYVYFQQRNRCAENPPSSNSIAVEFAQASSSFSEGAPTLMIDVRLSQASNSNVSFTVSPVSGNATMNVDYALTQKMTIPAGMTSANLPIVLLDDSEVEGPESVTLRISQVSGASLGSITTHILNIVDDDEPSAPISSPTPIVTATPTPTVTSPPAVTSTVVYAVNAGGPAMNAGGIAFAADPTFPGGCNFGPQSSNWGDRSSKPIAGSGNLLSVYQYHACTNTANPSYHFEKSLPNGQYRVRLFYAETWENAASRENRICTTVNGAQTVPGQKLGEQYGIFTAVEKTANLQVTTGKISVDSCSDGGIISGIVIEKMDGGVTPSPSPTPIPTVTSPPMTPPVANSVVYAVNAGGPAMNAGGIAFAADPKFPGGCDFGPQSSNWGDRSSKPIVGAGNLLSVYQYHACTNTANPTYHFEKALANGIYRVRLLYAETWENAAANANRICTTVNGSPVVPGQKLGEQYGVFTAVEKATNVQVNTGKISVDSCSSGGIISGIIIEKIDLDEASLAEIRFEKASSQFTESASEDFLVDVNVVLSKAMPVDVFAKVKMAGTAEKNSDFVAVNDVVYFKAGTTASKFKYLIKKDLNAAESTEYIDISFAELQNAKLSASGPNTHRLSIVNNANVGSTLDPAMRPQRFQTFLTLMTNRCFPCHTGGTASRLNDLVTEAQWANSSYVSPGNSGNSLLYTIVLGPQGPFRQMPVGSPLSDGDKKIIRDFIDGLPPAGSGAGASCDDQVSPVTMRRLTNRELTNSIRYLLNHSKVLEHRSDLPELPVNESGFNITSGNTGDVSGFWGIYSELVPSLVTASIDAGTIFHLTGQCDVNSDSCRRNIAKEIATLAFKGENPDSFLNRVYADTTKNGSSGKEKLAYEISAILFHPLFVNVIESHHDAGKNAVRALTPTELVTRLSLTIYQQVAPKELLALAKPDSSGKVAIQDSAIYASTVNSMLSDPRSVEFARYLADHWLQMRNIKDQILGFSDAQVAAVREEVQLFVDEVIRKDMPIGTFLDGKFTFMNSVNAPFYGQSMSSTQFTKVAFDAASTRQGLATQVAFIAMNSLPDLAKELKNGYSRGKNFLSTFVCQKMNPADLNGVEDDLFAPVGAPIEHTVQIHRSKPACYSCHQALDPIAVGLHQFDPRGVYRSVDSYGNPLRPSGEIFNQEFGDLAGLMNIVKSNSSYSSCISEKFFSATMSAVPSSENDQCSIHNVSNGVTANTPIRQVIRKIIDGKRFKNRVDQVK